MDDEVKWTVKYFEEFNRKAEELGFPKVIIDKDNMKVYKDELHRMLGIGVKLQE